MISSSLQVAEEQDEIEIQGRPLETTHGHGHAADEGVVDAAGIEIRDDTREDFGEVHGMTNREGREEF